MLPSLISCLLLVISVINVTPVTVIGGNVADPRPEPSWRIEDQAAEVLKSGIDSAASGIHALNYSVCFTVIYSFCELNCLEETFYLGDGAGKIKSEIGEKAAAAGRKVSIDSFLLTAETVSGIKEGLENKVRGAYETAANVGEGAKNAVYSAGEAVGMAAHNVGSGLSNAANNVREGVYNAASGAANTAGKALESMGKNLQTNPGS
ncbi:unnamed protein product [Enterobius vermicularis]|uniref:Senescence domain-containing protein n=1 Tax=Enterobius vermicularis TaxID=51028 RepID=A0A0N4UWJ4_ENTVE|nr:unnamed protein product [Enterobius vermicularis]